MSEFDSERPTRPGSKNEPPDKDTVTGKLMRAVARLESEMPEVKTDIREIKTDTRDLRDDLRDLRDQVQEWNHSKRSDMRHVSTRSAGLMSILTILGWIAQHLMLGGHH